MDLMKALTSQYMKEELPQMNVGDTVRVHVKIKEGARERVQVFEGTIIARKHGGIEESITVRRLSYGVGCEKVFPVHSPSIVKVETVRRGKVRRAKLYYLRNRLGKAAKVKEISAIAGGKGGGKPDFAMAGLKEETKIDEALAAVKGIVEKQLG